MSRAAPRAMISAKLIHKEWVNSPVRSSTLSVTYRLAILYCPPHLIHVSVGIANYERQPALTSPISPLLNQVYHDLFYRPIYILLAVIT